MTVSDCMAELLKAEDAIRELDAAMKCDRSPDIRTAGNIRNMLCEYMDMIKRLPVQED